MGLIDDIRAGVDLRAAGKTEEARIFFFSLWERLDKSEGLARCFLAHSMADVQDDPNEELHWDLLALDAAEEVTDEQAAERDVPGGRLGLYPSLHLNVAEAYIKLGDEGAARQHYFAGREHLHLLADDDYGRRLRRGFERFEQSITE